MSIVTCLLTVLLLCPLAVFGAGQMKVLYSWKEADFVFPPDKPRESYVSSGEFVPGNSLFMDVDVWNDKLFVTLPNFMKGAPVSLATVSDQMSNGSHLLQPYPDWSWHQGDCDGITSVLRTQVDECGRLWVVDSGRVEINTEFIQKCPPQILVFDLNTDKLVRRHRFPDSVLAGTSTLMVSVKVDIRSGNCNAAMSYIADCVGFQLFVYDFANDKSWRITNNLFYPYPLDGAYSINGVNFDLMDGVFGLALGPVTKRGDRILYFHSLSSVRESWVSTKVIRNSSLFEDNPGASSKAFHVSKGKRSSQSAVQDMADNGVIFYSLVVDNAVGCWNTNLSFTRENLDIVAKDDVTLQFQSGLKVYGDKLWTMSNRYQNFQANLVPRNEINYRINVGKVSKLIKKTKCCT